MNDDMEVESMVDELTATAQKAAADFRNYSTAQVVEIVKALEAAAVEKSAFYAEWAVRETGIGNVEDKIQKNLAGSSGLLEDYDAASFVEPQVDYEKKIISFPKPAGVVVALVPCTNPIVTVFYKAIICALTRNAVILCPHPRSRESSVHVANYMMDAAEKAGAPKGMIQILERPSIPVVTELMKSSGVDLVLATGGPDMVQAAYSSGNPAIGVGAANVACYVDKTADIEAAGALIVASNSFDNALPCACESTILADKEIDASLKAALAQSGGYFVSGENEVKLRKLLFQDGYPNADALGKSAQWLADQAGIYIPETTKSLIIEIDSVGPDELVSQEKMVPVLGYIKVDGVQGGIDTALSMLDMMGKGHSAVIHANDPSVSLEFGRSLPVCRIAVNTLGIIGSTGITTNLIRSAVIGTGYFGGSSVDENVGPNCLVQYTRVAYSIEPEIVMGDMDAAIKNFVRG